MSVQVFDGDGVDGDEVERAAAELAESMHQGYPAAMLWGLRCAMPTIVDGCRLVNGTLVNPAIHTPLIMNFAFDASAVAMILNTAIRTCDEIKGTPEPQILKYLFAEYLTRA